MRSNPYKPEKHEHVYGRCWRGQFPNMAGESAHAAWDRGYRDGLLQHTGSPGTGAAKPYSDGHSDGLHDSEAYFEALVEIESWGEDVTDLIPKHESMGIVWR